MSFPRPARLCFLASVSLLLACSPDGAGAGSGSTTSREPEPAGDGGGLDEDAGTGTTSRTPTGTDAGPATACTIGETRPCHPDPTVAGVGACALGTETCESTAEFGRWSACEGAVTPTDEVCENDVDDDCDGLVDEDCPTLVEVGVDLDGDCLTARCPDEAPYPIACAITMHGGDHRGCVASRPDDSVVYFQEGDACGAGRVTGTLTCSSEPGVGLNESNCEINKDTRYYPADRGGCPDTDG